MSQQQKSSSDTGGEYLQYAKARAKAEAAIKAAHERMKTKFNNIKAQGT